MIDCGIVKPISFPTVSEFVACRPLFPSRLGEVGKVVDYIWNACQTSNANRLSAAIFDDPRSDMHKFRSFIPR
jgi:hypothetical protein